MTSGPGPSFICPTCHRSLEIEAGTRLWCPRHADVLERNGGIWSARDLLRRPDVRAFLDHYTAVRRTEGWGSSDPAFVRALPYQDLTGRHPEIWRIRAASFDFLSSSVLRSGSPLRITDLGAGNGWLALRLAEAGHEVTAVDLSSDPLDGLGAAPAGTPGLTLIQASFDAVPLASGSRDLVLFNGSVHYSSDPVTTLREAVRLLAPGGRIAIIDSPVYRWAGSGHRMIREGQRAWTVGADRPRAIGFLTRRRLHAWGRELGIRWRLRPLPLGVRWHLGPLAAVLRCRREPARFPLIVGDLESRVRSVTTIRRSETPDL